MLTALETSTNKQAGADIQRDVVKVTVVPVLDDLSALGVKIWKSLPNNQVTSAVVQAKRTKIQSLLVTNENAAVRYIWLFNSTEAASTMPTQFIFAINAGTVNVPGQLEKLKSYFGDQCLFDIGLTFGISSSKTAYTTLGVNSVDHDISLIYM